ncbi:MAG: PLP-dependent aspartate aminotransferase family protein [Peptococcaceae bacterium]|jgi:cystathionine gamma-synthase|nr:PLP-dependent aspartate aminotransferase family protein [Peptococcaceae bacterium]
MEESNLDILAKTVKDIKGIDKNSASLRYQTTTQLVRGYSGIDKATGAVNTPVYQSALFAHPAFDESTGFSYSRVGNPTRLELENTIAMLEHGLKAWAFASGMAAISILLKLFSQGDHILVSNDLYGGTYRLFTTIYGKFGLEFSYVDTSHTEEIEAAIRPNTKAIFLETPSNPMMNVTDLQAVSAISKKHNVWMIVDNTFLSPYFQKPIDFGADIVIHSGTKYIGGHNDILSGFIVLADSELIEQIYTLSISEGGMLSPFDSWLTLRSLKTLAIRLERQQENAFKIVKFLKAHPVVDQVHYVGDPDHPGYELSKRQTTGFGGMISFSLKRAADVVPTLNHLKLVLFAESLGGTETLLTFPLVQTHAAIPEEMREKAGVNDRLLRLSVGIEDAEDVISDLDQALRGGRDDGR